MIIRVARPEERVALEALQRRASLMNEADRDWLLANPEVIHLPFGQIAAGQVIVAESAVQRLGFAVVAPRDDGDADLDGLFVEPEFWRTGVGRGLVEAAQIKARRIGAKVLHVVGNPNARDFYLACGFEILGEVPTQFRSGLAMKKAL